MRSVEAVNGFMFTVMFPLTFVANTFAPTASMPSVAADDRGVEPGLVARPRRPGSCGATARAAPTRAAWPLQHAPLVTLVWAVLITAVFAPLALAAFRRRARD